MRERKGEKHQCVAASHVPPTGDLACNPVMCPDWESNLQPFGSQAGTQSIEPYQPGPNQWNFYLILKVAIVRAHLSSCPLLRLWSQLLEPCEKGGHCLFISWQEVNECSCPCGYPSASFFH